MTDPKHTASVMGRGDEHDKPVIVESGAKGKKIQAYLGSDYIVESCRGHVQDLPAEVSRIANRLTRQCGPPEMMRITRATVGMDRS